jgi:glutathione S-transferase
LKPLHTVRHVFGSHDLNLSLISVCLFPDPTASAIFKEVVMKPRTGGVPNPAVIAAGKALWASKLDAYEKILEHRPYLSGNNVTLADLFHLPYGQKLIDAGHGEALMDHKARPHVAK